MTNSYYYQLSGASGIGQVNTVSSGPDDGTLNCLASYFWNAMRHKTTAEATNNFLSQLSKYDARGLPIRVGEDSTTISFLNAGLLNLVGHGNLGLVETGQGQSGPFDPNTFIMSWNRDGWWGAQLAKLANKNFMILSIYSCYTGGGAEGAELLYEMATILQKPVQGRTGETLCGASGISFEPNSVWQVATPQSKPTPIQPPSPPPHLYNESMRSVILRISNKDQSIPVESIASARIRRRSFRTGIAAETVLQGTEAGDFVLLCLNSKPRIPEGTPLAIPTAYVEFTFEFAGVAHDRKLTIYADRTASDLDSGYSYYAHPSLREVLNSM